MSRQKKIVALYRVEFNVQADAWILESQSFSETENFYVSLDNSFRINKSMYNSGGFAISPAAALRIRINQAQYDIEQGKKRLENAQKRLGLFRTLAQDRGINLGEQEI